MANQELITTSSASRDPPVAQSDKSPEPVVCFFHEQPQEYRDGGERYMISPATTIAQQKKFVVGGDDTDSEATPELSGERGAILSDKGMDRMPSSFDNRLFSRPSLGEPNMKAWEAGKDTEPPIAAQENAAMERLKEGCEEKEGPPPPPQPEFHPGEPISNEEPLPSTITPPTSEQYVYHGRPVAPVPGENTPNLPAEPVPTEPAPEAVNLGQDPAQTQAYQAWSIARTNANRKPMAGKPQRSIPTPDTNPSHLQATSGVKLPTSLPLQPSLPPDIDSPPRPTPGHPAPTPPSPHDNHSSPPSLPGSTYPSTAHTPLSRTQQKLFLQRQHVLAEDPNHLAHPRNQRLLKKEMERLNREYVCLRRFEDPIMDSLQRCFARKQQMGLGSQPSSARSH
ncbi:uncharacterized protein VTP21DRAFT_8459 [Calcarisporiella thermophila]|uniref:uncharacterized protein n=1 Tax=Calcarisporiella thermophila TaxID=911321 RepID=UPI00374237DA